MYIYFISIIFEYTGSIEGKYAIDNKELERFSEQQLIDCDKTNHGCEGGWLPTALL
jgi:hypothetical protein